MSEMLKICHIGHKNFLERSGGVEVVVKELSTRMAALGYDVTCYNRWGHHSCIEKSADNNLSKLKIYQGVKIKYVPTIPAKGLAAMTSSFFAAIRGAFGQYQIVHFHAEGSCAMLWIPKFFGKRCIVTIHGLDHQRAKWGRFAKNYIMLGEKCAVRYADEIIVLSKDVQNYFREKYGRETKFIPNGVNRPSIQKPEWIKEQFGLERDSYLLFIGRLVPEKGLSYLVHAFKEVKTNKKLVIAGDSSDTDAFTTKLKALAANDKRIIFTGFVQGKLLDELYSNAYIYILPSDLEGMPLSLMEAMSYGNCCLTSDIAECVEVVEDHAVTFRKSDVVDLCDKMQMLCDNGELIQQYRKGIADFICNKFNWDDVVEQTLELYGISRDI